MSVRRTSRQKGFTLIEVMITVLILAILTRIALPSYRNYVIRGQLVNAANGLAASRALMEQYFQDNRQYTTVSASITPPCSTTTYYPSATSGNKFAVTCLAATLSANAYVITATGSGLVNGFVYTIDQTNTQRTTGLPANWISSTLPVSCWVMKRGQTC